MRMIQRYTVPFSIFIERDVFKKPKSKIKGLLNIELPLDVNYPDFSQGHPNSNYGESRFHSNNKALSREAILKPKNSITLIYRLL